MRLAALGLALASIWYSAGCAGESNHHAASGAGGQGAFAGQAAGSGGQASGAGGQVSGMGGAGMAAGMPGAGVAGGAGTAGDAGGLGGTSGAGASAGGAEQAGAGMAGGVPAAGTGPQGCQDLPEGVAPFADLSRNILTTRLSIDLDTMQGKAAIAVEASPSSHGISFEVGDLKIKSVTSDDMPLLCAVRGDRLDIEVPTTTNAIGLTIVYNFGYHENFDGISESGYTFTWPYFCGNVFPCHSDPSDGTTFELNIQSGQGSAIYPAEINFDGPAYMAGWAWGDYQRYFDAADTRATHFSLYYLGTDAPLAGIQQVMPAFDWLEAHIGSYSFGTGIASIAVPWSGGSYQGVDHHPYWHVAESAASKPSVQLNELAHGWFGDAVRLACWEDLVLSEGTSSYLAAHLLEAVGLAADAEALWQEYESDLAEGIAWPMGCGEVDVLADGLYSPANRARGALFLRALAQRVGDSVLDDALKEFYSRYAGKAAHVDDLLTVVHDVAGYTPNGCANLWLRTAAVPPFNACE